MAARKAARRQTFLETAADLFARNGYHETTVPMIVREAGSSTGAFYFYFRNKEDVFAAVLEHIGVALSASLNQAIGKRRGVPGQMGAAVDALVHWLAEHPAEARVLIVESAGLSGCLEQVRRTLIDSHVRSVERAIRHVRRRIPGADATLLARCWVGAALEAVRAWLDLPSGKRPPARTVARLVKSFNLRGIGARLRY